MYFTACLAPFALTTFLSLSPTAVQRPQVPKNDKSFVKKEEKNKLPAFITLNQCEGSAKSIISLIIVIVF